MGTGAKVANGDDRGKAEGTGHRQRLRDSLLAGGAEGFHDYELLEYFLALAIPRRDTKPLAKTLLAEFGGLPAVLAAAPAQLTAVGGLGPGGAAALKFAYAIAIRALQREAQARPVLSGWQALTDYLHAAMAHRTTEEFRVIFLDTRNMILRDEAMGEGTVGSAPAYPREIVKRALDLAASSMILVHNHPSGDPAASRDDITLTKAIVAAGKLFDIAVHDHVIVGRSGHSSMRAQGLI